MFAQLVFALLFVSPDLPPVKDGKFKPAPVPDDLSGHYLCAGTDADGKKYTGLVTILKKGDAHIVQWMITGAGSYTGIGIRTSDNFSVAWTLSGKDGVLIKGVTQFRLVSPAAAGIPHQLVGRWLTLPGTGRIQAETLVFFRALPDED